MSAWTSPKGPLPGRVYWFRRLVLLAVVFVVVFGTARVLGAGGDGEPEADAQATTAGAEVAPEVADEPKPEPEEQAAPPAEAAPTPEPTPEPPPLPEPSGVCANNDVVVTPVVGAPRTDGQVDMALTLRTRSTPACTWQVSPKTVTIKISSGSDDYWFSSHCPRAVPTQDVVLYAETDTSVPFVWSGRRSDPECSRLTDWAMPGFYHVMAAAFEGEPTEVQFERTAASVTATRAPEPEPEPEQKKNKKNKNKKKNQQRSGPDGQGGQSGQSGPAEAEPSGAVEPTLRP